MRSTRIRLGGRSALDGGGKGRVHFASQGGKRTRMQVGVASVEQFLDQDVKITRQVHVGRMDVQLPGQLVKPGAAIHRAWEHRVQLAEE